MNKALEVAANPMRYFATYGASGIARRVWQRTIGKPLSRKAQSDHLEHLASLPVLREDQGKKVLFQPDLPHVPNYIVLSILKTLALEPTGEDGPNVIARMAWKDATSVDGFLEGLNSKCHSVAKERVQEIAAQVFGYPLAVDPRSHRGKAVRKSDTNGMHDGAIVECPCEPEEGYVYQRVVNNVDGRFVEDMRTVVIGDEIPLIYVKRRRAYERFKNTETSRLAKADDLLSSAEQAQVLTLARELGLDHGEVDVLRDRDNGLIYVVDANKTPFGPPRDLAFEDKAKAVRLMAEAWERQFLNVGV